MAISMAELRRTIPDTALSESSLRELDAAMLTAAIPENTTSSMNGRYFWKSSVSPTQ